MMSDLRNSPSKELPAGMTRQPVEGKIKGSYVIGPDEAIPFDFSKLVYVTSQTSPYTYLEAVSDDGGQQVIFSGPVSIEEPGHYQISDDLQQLEAQFYISNSDYISYGPSLGGFTVRFVTPESGHKRIEGDAAFILTVEDDKGDSHELNVKIERFDFKSNPV